VTRDERPLGTRRSRVQIRTTSTIGHIVSVHRNDSGIPPVLTSYATTRSVTLKKRKIKRHRLGPALGLDTVIIIQQVQGGQETRLDYKSIVL